MHVARWIVLGFIVAAILIASSPEMRAVTGQAWDHARPNMLQVMDGVYAMIRSFVAGSDPHEGIDDDAPGVDFDIITTLSRGNTF